MMDFPRESEAFKILKKYSPVYQRIDGQIILKFTQAELDCLVNDLKKLESAHRWLKHYRRLPDTPQDWDDILEVLDK